MRVQQLVNDVGVIARDGLADLGARVTAGQGTRHHQQALEHDLVPARRRDVLQMRECELLMRIVDEGAQVALFLLGELVAEDIVHVLAHHARAVVENMQERLVFTVQIAHEMLGALGQVEDCLQVDDLGKHRLLRGKMLREQAQVLERLVGAGDHGAAPPFCWMADTCFQITTPRRFAPKRQSGTGAKLRMGAKSPRDERGLSRVVHMTRRNGTPDARGPERIRSVVHGALEPVFPMQEGPRLTAAQLRCSWKGGRRWNRRPRRPGTTSVWKSRS